MAKKRVSRSRKRDLNEPDVLEEINVSLIGDSSNIDTIIDKGNGVKDTLYIPPGDGEYRKEVILNTEAYSDGPTFYIRILDVAKLRELGYTTFPRIFNCEDFE